MKEVVVRYQLRTCANDKAGCVTELDDTESGKLNVSNVREPE